MSIKIKLLCIGNIWTSGSYDKNSEKWYWLSTQKAVTYANWQEGLNPNTGPSYRLAHHKAIKPYWESLPKSNMNHYICEVSYYLNKTFLELENFCIKF